MIIRLANSYKEVNSRASFYRAALPFKQAIIELRKE
jgi:hypothetical protein